VTITAQQREYKRQWRNTPDGKRRVKLYDSRRNKQWSKDWYIRTTYGLSREQVNQMRFDQWGLCAACSEPLGDNSRNTHIDHNHTTKQLRGILCQRCNQALGLLRDSAALCDKLGAYRRRFENDSP
jgi:hypothetical protein